VLLLRILQHTLVHSKPNSLSSRPRPEAIHPRLQALLSSIEMHTCQLTHRQCLQIHSNSATGKYMHLYYQQQDQALYFPDRLVDCFDVGRDVGNALDRVIMCCDHFSCCRLPV